MNRRELFKAERINACVVVSIEDRTLCRYFNVKAVPRKGDRIALGVFRVLVKGVTWMWYCESKEDVEVAVECHDSEITAEFLLGNGWREE